MTRHVPAAARRAPARPRWRGRWPFVLAAHPDDETIGAGGLLVGAGQGTIVLLTDGAPRDRRFWPAGVAGPRDAYAWLRRGELADALRAGGVDGTVHELRARDQEAVRRVPDLARALADLLGRERPPALLTHAYEGGHPDHDAAAVVARAAVALLRRAGRPHPRLLEMASYHAYGGRLVTGRFLPGSGGREVVRVLSPDLRERKARMLAAHASQQQVLASFAVDEERFRRAPRLDFREPPHGGPLCYEEFGFPLRGDAWRGAVAAALRELGLAPDAASPAASCS